MSKEEAENKKIEIQIVDSTKSSFTKYVIPGLCVIGALAAGVIIGARCSQLVEDTISRYV